MGTTRDVSDAIRTGFIESTDVDKVTARVRIPDLDDLISYDLQVLQQNTRKNKDVWMPDLQEEVVCLFMGNGLECGFILGSLYNAVDTPPVASQDKRHITFADGTVLEYDRKEHRLTADVKGDVNIAATGNVKVSGARIDLN